MCGCEAGTLNLVSCPRDSQHNSPAGHPVCRRCSSVEYVQYWVST